MSPLITSEHLSGVVLRCIPMAFNIHSASRESRIINIYYITIRIFLMAACLSANGLNNYEIYSCLHCPWVSGFTAKHVVEYMHS